MLGIVPRDTRFDLSMPYLREFIPAWTLSALRSVTSAIVLKGWEKSGISASWDEGKQMKALESIVTRPLFDEKFEYVVPDDDDPPEITEEDDEETKDPTQDEYWTEQDADTDEDNDDLEPEDTLTANRSPRARKPAKSLSIVTSIVSSQ
jgi:hypothetical protein